MNDPKDPVKQLTDTLTLLRVEIADVKNRQITEKRLKQLQAVLENTTTSIEKVAECAEAGGERGAGRLASQVGQTTRKLEDSTHAATQSLSDAQRGVEDSFLAQKRNIRLLLIFSASLGLLLGAFVGVWLGEYKLATGFGESIQGSEATWYCEQAGGNIYDQKGRIFCGIWTGK